jgi:hypothetical protein
MPAEAIGTIDKTKASSYMLRSMRVSVHERMQPTRISKKWECIQRFGRPYGRWVDAYSLQQLQKKAKQPKEVKQIHVLRVSARLAERRICGHPPVHGLNKASTFFAATSTRDARCTSHVAYSPFAAFLMRANTASKNFRFKAGLERGSTFFKR